MSVRIVNFVFKFVIEAETIWEHNLRGMGYDRRFLRFAYKILYSSVVPMVTLHGLFSSYIVQVQCHAEPIALKGVVQLKLYANSHHTCTCIMYRTVGIFRQEKFSSILPVAKILTHKLFSLY